MRKAGKSHATTFSPPAQRLLPMPIVIVPAGDPGRELASRWRLHVRVDADVDESELVPCLRCDGVEFLPLLVGWSRLRRVADEPAGLERERHRLDPAVLAGHPVEHDPAAGRAAHRHHIHLARRQPRLRRGRPLGDVLRGTHAVAHVCGASVDTARQIRSIRVRDAHLRAAGEGRAHGFAEPDRPVPVSAFSRQRRQHLPTRRVQSPQTTVLARGAAAQAG